MVLFHSDHQMTSVKFFLLIKKYEFFSDLDDV